MAIRNIEPTGSPTADLYTQNVDIDGGSTYAHEALSDASDTTRLHMPDVQGNISYAVMDLQNVTLDSGEHIIGVRINHKSKSVPVGPNVFETPCDLIFDLKRPAPGGGYLHNELARYSRLRTSGADYVGQWQPLARGVSGQFDTAWTEEIINAEQLVVYETGITPDRHVYVLRASVDLLTNFEPGVANVGPDLVVTDTTTPTVTWDYNDPDGDVQVAYRVRGFTSAQIEADGFDPATTTPAVDSGVVSSSLGQWKVTAPLDNGQSYKFWPSVYDGRFWSPVAPDENFAAITIDVGSPAIPEISVQWNGALPPNETVALVSIGNLLTDDIASIDTLDLDDLVSVSDDFTATLTTDDPFQGTKALRITNDFAGSADGVVEFATLSVVPGMGLSALASVRGDSTNLIQMQLGMAFYDEEEAYISAETGPVIDSFDGTGGWAQPFAQNVLVPEGSANVTLFLALTMEEEGVIDIDAISLSSRRVNLARLPLLDKDFDNDGFPNGWDAVNTGEFDTAPTYSYDPDQLLFGTRGTQKMAVTVNTGTKGWSQDISIPDTTGDDYFSLAAWVMTDKSEGATITLDANLGIGGASVADWDGTNTFEVGSDGFVCVQVKGTIESLSSNGRRSISVTTDEENVTVWLALVQATYVADNDIEHDTYDPEVQVLPDNWTRGSIAGKVSYDIQRSSDGMNSWETMRRADQVHVFGVGRQLYQTTDWDIPDTDGSPLFYRARAIYTDPSTGQTVSSAWTAPRRVNVPITLDGFYLVSLTDSQLSRRFQAEIPVSSTSTEDQGVFKPLGRKESVVVHGDLGGENGSFNIIFFSDGEFQAFERLRTAQQTLLLIDPFGERRYVSLGATREIDHVADGTRAYRVTYVETTRPPFTETEIPVIDQGDVTKVPPLPNIPPPTPGPEPDPEPDPEPEDPPVTTTSAKVQFGAETTVAKTGYRLDFGEAYTAARGYGWVSTSGAPLSLVGNGRDRGGLQLNELLDGFMHMQLPESTQGVHETGWWQMDIVNGTYYVKVGVGDPSYTNSVHKVDAEAATNVVNFTPTASTKVYEAGATVVVSDGKLTLKPGSGAVNTKICYVEVSPGAAPPTPPAELIPPRGSGLWALAYEDNFETINTTRWGIYQYGPGNEGVGYRHPSMIKKGGDGLEIWTQLQTSGPYSGQRWGGGMFLKGFNQRYARVEMELKVDLGPGSGPAIMMWMSNNDWPDGIECDILEIPRGDRVRGNHTMHRGPYSNGSHPQSGKAFTHNWLNWTWLTGEWTPQGWRVWVDGEKANEWLDSVWQTTVLHHLVIQNDIGGNGFIQAPNGTEPNPSKLYVRKVRWYRYTGPNAALT